MHFLQALYDNASNVQLLQGTLANQNCCHMQPIRVVKPKLWCLQTGVVFKNCFDDNLYLLLSNSFVLHYDEMI